MLQGKIRLGQMDRAFAGAGVDLQACGGVGVYPQLFSGQRRPKRTLFGAMSSDENILVNIVLDEGKQSQDHVRRNKGTAL